MATDYEPTTSHFILLNVGGSKYVTSMRTLTAYPNSMLGSMFNGKIPSTRDQKGRYFIDANGEMFKYVLDFLRRNQLLLPKGFKEYDLLLAEAEFYQIQPLIDAIRIRQYQEVVSLSNETVLLCGDTSGHVFHAYFQVRGKFHVIHGKKHKATFLIYSKILDLQGFSLTHGPSEIDKTNFFVWLANMYSWGVIGDGGDMVKSDPCCVTYEIWRK